MDSLGAGGAGWEELYDLSSPLVFFPVRHHSPACCLHLERTLEAYRPDALLIEGPSDTQHLLEHIGNPENLAPLCIYYSARHKEQTESGKTEEFRSACYYPLLDFSPELLAIRYGIAQGVETRWIDLPYSALSLIERAGRQDEGKSAYYDDYYLSRSRFIARLCEKQGCRHYGELWEKLFELGGLEMETAEFVRSMLALCHYARVEYPPELLQAEGCVSRERYMAAEIQRAQKQFSRVLVITGGFHTAALAELLKAPVQPDALPTAQAEAYLIPYSFAESDQLAGYASGMPYPAFYQSVFERMRRGDAAPYDGAVLEFLAGIGGRLRKRKQSTSIADEVAASMQSRGLGQLRDKPQQGVYELLDGVRSAYVKGEMDFAASAILRAATELLQGERMGRVASGAEQVPLLLDFREQAKRHRLKIDKTLRQEASLDILSRPAHRETSAFFHRLRFLEAGFGERRYGPSYRDRDTARVREKWTYALSARVEAAIIDKSYLGGTVREAAATLLSRSRQEHVGAGECSRLLIDAAVMDLTEQIDPLIESISSAVAEDGSFASLSLCARNLLFLENAKWLLNLPDDGYAAALLEETFQKAVSLIPSLETAVEEEDRELAKTLNDLHLIARRDGMDEEVFAEALRELCERAEPLPPPALEGAAAGLLYASGQYTVQNVLRRADSYLFGSGEMMVKSGRFLSGVFLSAWDILFADDGFLAGIGHVLESLEPRDFLTLLPDLRLAFSTFTPSQIDRISGVVARLSGVEEGALDAPAVSEELLVLGRELDRYAVSMLTRGGEGRAG